MRLVVGVVEEDAEDLEEEGPPIRGMGAGERWLKMIESQPLALYISPVTE